jgi:hypothetical protein
MSITFTYSTKQLTALVFYGRALRDLGTMNDFLTYTNGDERRPLRGKEDTLPILFISKALQSKDLLAAGNGLL